VGGPAFERLGWDPDDIVGRLPSELLSDGSGEVLEQHMRAALRGETHVFDHAGLRDAAGFWRSTVVPVRDDSGAVVAGMIVSRDVAPVLDAQRGRRESEERFAVALDAAPVTVYAQDRELRFIWANKTVLNPDVESIVGKTDVEVLPPQAAARTVPAKQQVLATGEPVRLLFEAPGPTGQLRWYDMTISATRDDVGEITGVVGAALDVTELRSSERRLQDALEAMLDSVTVQRPVFDDAGNVVDFRISYATENAIDFAGRRRDELIDRTLRELFPELGDDFIASYAWVLQTGEGMQFNAFPYPDAQGRELLYDLAVSRLGDSLLVTWREVTEREASRAMVATGSAIRSASEELQRGLLPPEPPVVPGIEFAATYHPALETAEVGGDWYDVVRHPEAGAGPVVDVIVGDVEGHDGHAAALMARYSTLVRAACTRQESVEAVIEELREFHRSMEGQRLVTIAVARIQVDTGDVSLLSAGHPPPLVCHGTGSVEPVEMEVDPPVGAPGGVGGLTHLRLGAGETLVMFSDGLLDPQVDPDDAYTAIAQVTSGAGGSAPGDLVTALADYARGHQPSDDVVVVVAHRPVMSPHSGRVS
jgi:PAS domain S-box-containing protein